jgi:hypothetical protein
VNDDLATFVNALRETLRMPPLYQDGRSLRGPRIEDCWMPRFKTISHVTPSVKKRFLEHHHPFESASKPGEPS